MEKQEIINEKINFKTNLRFIVHALYRQQINIYEPCMNVSGNSIDTIDGARST